MNKRGAPKKIVLLLWEMVREIGTEVKNGNMDAFERFFIEGGTEEGDAKMNELQERIALRYLVRKESIKL